ncbi:Uncharacterised protein [Neisseria gonorrhoeae]|uniref:Uncharacterized protein n=1 Tax=Neisseria gonorrhoeae TaxID=485 RepID=A0A378VZX5_NEIGO|nr:Uncharacterised protein [Neisseria gonorrhoeae]
MGIYGIYSLCVYSAIRNMGKQNWADRKQRPDSTVLMLLFQDNEDSLHRFQRLRLKNLSQNFQKPSETFSDGF